MRHKYTSKTIDKFTENRFLVTTQNPAPLISMLKGLAASNLSHLTPHPLMVFLSYSHPPVIDRVAAVRARL